MHENSIKLLNQAVSEEIAALHQYMYFHFHCDDQGYDLLAGLFKRTAIEEMLHVERLAERILLGGDVNMVSAGPVEAVQEVNEMLTMARKMELESATHYNLWANEVAQVPTVSPKRSLRIWWLMKSVITTSTMTRWAI